MKVFTIPNDIFSDNVTKLPELILHDYYHTRESIKGKISAGKHIFSFLQEGQKEVHFYDKSISLTSTQAVLIPAGNCLMTEKRVLHDKQYRSFLFFFSDANLIAFRKKYSFLFTAPDKNRQEDSSFFLFEQDEFIKNFIQSLQQIFQYHTTTAALSEHLLVVKFEEIMLYLCDRYGKHFLPLLASLAGSPLDLPMRQVVENNIYRNLSVEELAFLCNMSLSTFKRKFEEIYGTAPSRWFHLKKMQQAAFLLKHEKANASEIHHELGYENLSSFVQAFKKEFGKTPKVYQQSV
jgi:AraC-like DNA-binding protein